MRWSRAIDTRVVVHGDVPDIDYDVIAVITPRGRIIAAKVGQKNLAHDDDKNDLTFHDKHLP